MNSNEADWYFDTDGNPVNPWWNENQASTDCYYYVKFDINHDSVIDEGPGNEPPDTQVRRPVIIWTQDPSVPEDSSLRWIRSW